MTLTAEEQEWVDGYRALKKRGLPEGAIRHKMTVDGAPPHVQDAVFAAPATDTGSSTSAPSSSRPVGAAPSTPASALSAQDEATVAKFTQQLKIGLPPPAVEREMNAAGVSRLVQDIVMGRTKPPTPAPPASSSSDQPNGSANTHSNPSHDGNDGAPDQKLSSLSPEDEKIATPFREMYKIGVPHPAILNKMQMAGVAQHVQDSVMAGEVAPARSTIVDVPAEPLPSVNTRTSNRNTNVLPAHSPAVSPIKPRVNTRTAQNHFPVKSYVPTTATKPTSVRSFVPPLTSSDGLQQQSQEPEFKAAAAAMAKKRQQKWNEHVQAQQPQETGEEKKNDDDDDDSYAFPTQPVPKQKKAKKDKKKKKKKRRRRVVSEQPDRSTDCGCCYLM